MKCPNCGKKMKKDTCKACGYDATATVATASTMNVNYFTYDPKNPNVVFPMSVSGQGKPNPMIKEEAPVVAPMSKKEAKKAEKAAAKEAAAAEKAEQIAAKEAAKAAATKNWFLRLFAIVVMAMSVCALAVLSFGAVLQFVAVGENAVPDVQYGNLLTILTTAMQSETKVFGILPALFTGEGADLYNLAVYVFVAFALISVILAVLANTNVEKAPKRVRRSLFILGVGALFYTIAMALTLKGANISGDSLAKLNMLKVYGLYFDKFSLIVGIAALALSFIVNLHRNADKK